MISMLPHFGCIIRFWQMSLEEIKLITVVNWFFHVSDFLRVFMMYFKYGLISSRNSLIDRVLFLLPLLSYSIKLLFKNLPNLTGF